MTGVFADANANTPARQPCNRDKEYNSSVLGQVKMKKGTSQITKRDRFKVNLGRIPTEKDYVPKEEKMDKDQITDWEMEEFVNPDPEKKELKLEDFQTDEVSDSSMHEGVNIGRLQEVIEEVKAVKGLMETGKDAEQIAGLLGMEKDRVLLIQMSMYGGEGDDNEVAVAHMVMMEEE